MPVLEGIQLVIDSDDRVVRCGNGAGNVESAQDEAPGKANSVPQAAARTLCSWAITISAG